jgi:uncharacterized protein YijF (DUF1287 family)
MVANTSTRTGKTVRAFTLFLLISALTPPEAQTDEAVGFFARLSAAAVERTRHAVTYDGSYRSIRYPMGDVPNTIGVCTDVVVRSYRAVGVDLQVLVHEDMSAHFSEYPDDWGLTAPDPNIDHRRVVNLQTFFRRQGAELPITADPTDYKPGDLVTWSLPGNAHHIGIVVDQRSPGSRRPLVVHNLLRGPQVEDILFRFPITGHFRFDGSDSPDQLGILDPDS